MNLHPLLLEQLAHWGLNETTAPSVQVWQQLLSALNPTYHRAEQHPYQAAFYQQSQDAVLVVTAQGRCLAANGMAGFMFGNQFDLAQSYDLAALLPPALLDLFLTHIQQLFQQQRPGRWSYHFADKNLTRYQEAQISLLDPEQALIIVRDVTEQRWGDDSARIAREYFKRLIQGLHVGMLIYGVDGELLLSNRQARSLLGLSESQPWDDGAIDQAVQLVQEDGSPFAGFMHLVREFVQSGAAGHNTVIGVYRTAHEERIWLLVNIRAEYNQGALEWITITLNDITDLRHTESALRVSEKLYQSLVNSIREVIFQIDSDGCWLFLNPAWTQITGYTLQESVSQPVFTFIHPTDRELVRTALQNMRLGQHSFDLHEVRCLTKAGGFRWLSLHSDPIFSEDNTLVGITGTLIDITERKQSESQAAELAAKEKLVVALRTLLDYLSHDLRTPLSVINANLFLMRRKITDTAAVQSYVSILEQQTQRLAQMVEDVVTVSTLDNETDTFTFTYLDLHQLIGAVVIGFERELRTKSLLIQQRLAADLPLLRADQIWLTRMIKHLLLNAIQFSSANGVITLTTQAETVGVCLTVSDNGSGIHPEDLPHIFDHFYRADKSRPNAAGGAGLGLTIVKKVVEAHHGVITVTSTLGQGTTFQVQLPLRP
jgi:PAS domain S-box-containing protein